MACGPSSIIAAVAKISAVAASPAMTVTVDRPACDGFDVVGSMR